MCIILYATKVTQSHSPRSLVHQQFISVVTVTGSYRKFFGQFVTLVAALSIVCIGVVTPYLMLPLGLKLLLLLRTARLLAQQISLFVFTLQFEEYTMGNGSHYCTSLT